MMPRNTLIIIKRSFPALNEPRLYPWLMRVGAEHLSPAETMRRIQRQFYWSRWREDIDIYIKACRQCACYFRGKPKHQGEMQYMQVGEPMERLAIDVTGPFPRSLRGNVWILTVIDTFTRYAWAFPVRNHTAPVVAKHLIQTIFTEFGAPRQILSDRGTEFQSELISELCRIMEIDKLRTTSYKPSTNGCIERFHKSLNQRIGRLIEEHQQDWDTHIPFVLASYRATQHTSTSFTPNYLMFGREVNLPLSFLCDDIEEGGNDQRKPIIEFVANQREKFQEAFKIARETDHKMATRNKVRYDLKTRPVKFKRAFGPTLVLS